MGLLKVEGRGRATAEPDTVEMSFEVQTQASKYTAAFEELNRRTESLRASLQSAGVERKDVKTTDFGVHTGTTGKRGDYLRDGYTASHTVRLTMPLERERLNQVLCAVSTGTSGAAVHMTYTVKDEEPLRRQAMEDAVRVAKANAERLAAAAGCKLVRLHQVDYGAVQVRIEHRHSELTLDHDMSPSGPTPDIDPADVAAVDRVILTYETE